MKHFKKNLLNQFIKDESGAAAIEYGLMISGIALAIQPVVNAIGQKLTADYTQILNALH